MSYIRGIVNKSIQTVSFNYLHFHESAVLPITKNIQEFPIFIIIGVTRADLQMDNDNKTHFTPHINYVR